MLNLIAENETEKILLDYLQENTSPALTEKINNGVTVYVDGKQLTNKKTLKGCLQYCCQEARKLDDKSNSVGVADSLMFGWTMHYFEEDTIHGDLYNADGSVYKKEPTAPIATVATSKPVVKKEPNAQMSFFDVQEEATEQEPDTDEQEDVVTEHNQVQDATNRCKNALPSYKTYCEVQAKYADCILLQRLGDFYEAFDKSAETLANAVDLTLTSKDVGLPERVALAGIPYHMLDNYVAKIIDKGYKVAILESDGTTTNVATGEITAPLENATDSCTTDNVDNNIKYLQNKIPNLEVDL